MTNKAASEKFGIPRTTIFTWRETERDTERDREREETEREKEGCHNGNWDISVS